MTAIRKALVLILVVTLSVSLAGCFGSAHRGQGTAISQHPESAPGQSGFSGPSSDATASRDPQTVSDVSSLTASAVNSYIRGRLAEAEALYATGVAANNDGRWHDAQLAFEQATTILAELDLEPSPDSNPSPTDSEEVRLQVQFTRLLREIAHDYRFTLDAVGELDPDASISAFLLQFNTGEPAADSDDNEDTTKVAVALPTPNQEQAEVQYDFPVENNDEVINCIVYFQTLAREPFETFLRRSGRYLPMMKEIVASYGLPTDVAYLPLIESGFNNRAYSYAHASGPWQFIASTGRRYGLNRTRWVDERCDFEKSTHAACQYLRDLYGMFGSWPLALAAYNGGEGHVGRQIARQGTNDFWQLKLHDQTSNYVPLFMAALMIAKDPATFGFRVEPDLPLAFDWVATEKSLELKGVAAALDCDVSTLEDLNPELRRGVTPPDMKPYRLRVPANSAKLFAATYQMLPESKQMVSVQHTVRRGETLDDIAKQYSVSITAIARTNKLRTKSRLQVGQALTIPTGNGTYADASDSDDAPVPAASTPRRSASKGQDYTVRRGETLWDLAKKFGTTTSAIRRTNGMSATEKLVAGQTITMPGRGPASDKSSGGSWYTIRRGDTMSELAARFGVGLRRLLALNSNINPRNLRAGQRIRIPQNM